MNKAFKLLQWISAILLLFTVAWWALLNQRYEQLIEQRRELNSEYQNAIERIDAINEQAEEINERLADDINDLRLRVLRHLGLEDQ